MRRSIKQLGLFTGRIAPGRRSHKVKYGLWLIARATAALASG
jgi:hypothetical protein